jgi:hypothetical protein
MNDRDTMVRVRFTSSEGEKIVSWAMSENIANELIDNGFFRQGEIVPYETEK